MPALDAKESTRFGFACFNLPFGSFALKRKTPSVASPARPPAQPAHLPAAVGGAQTKAGAAHSSVGSSLTTANAAHSYVGSSLTTANAAHSCVAAPFAHARAILAYGRETLAYGRGTLAYGRGTLAYSGASPLGLWTVATPVPTPHIAAREPPARPRTAPRPAPFAPPASLGPSGPIGPVPSGPGPGLSRVRKVHPRRLLPEPQAREAQRLPHAAPPRAS